MNIKSAVKKICINAKMAANDASNLTTELKNKILLDVAHEVRTNIAVIIAENKKDVEFAKKNNIENAKLDRLILDENRINALANSLIEISHLTDPTHKVLYHTTRDNGLNIKRVTCPIGVLLAIFESRPNVAIDISALAFKSSNAVILRAGSESINSAKILVDIFRKSLEKFSVNKDFVYLVESTNRDYVKELLKMQNFIDVVIPRGGKSLIEAVMKGTKIPVFKHLDGNCHTYVHTKADFEKARKITLNAKLRRVGVCGATESLLIDKKIAKEFLPLIAHDLFTNGCEMRGDNMAQALDSRISPATKQDFKTEYLDKIISIKIVKNLDDAIDHINKFGSAHTESIITEDETAVKKFFARVDSAIVMHNASTQFADGGEFGLGAEVGIATGKLHARGPVGLEQLVTYKYIVDADCALRK